MGQATVSGQESTVVADIVQFPKWIRDEANEVKGCFTTFSFQAIALSGIVLGAMAAYQPNQPFVGLAGLLVIVVVLTVSEIGNYKYGTANRHFGYQLLWETVPEPAERGRLFDGVR